jgi:tetrathionate reductase subunit B
MCISACPYDARFFNPIRDTADKCDFCVTRIDNGLTPACVEACLTGAIIFGDLDDPDSEISKTLSKTGATVLKPELGTRPKVFYIAAERDLKGRIKFSESFQEQIHHYNDHIPSPDADYWNKEE